MLISRNYLFVTFLKYKVNQKKIYRIFTIPNLLSILRILLILPIALLIWHNNLSLVLLLVVIAVITDFLDGIIARRLNQISEWGKVLDPLADKLAIGAILIVLYLKHLVPLWLVVIVVGRDLAIVLAGLFLAQKYQIVTSSNFIGKVAANVLAVMVISFIFGIEILQKIFTPLAVMFMVISSFSYLKKFIKIQKIEKDIPIKV